MLDLLKSQGKYDDTVIMFISDNGSNPREPHFYPPNTLESIEPQVPLIVSGPGIGRRGIDTSQLLHAAGGILSL